MKKNKIALTLVCAILLVAASVMGTLAYLTSTSEAVVNTFTVGANVAIKLDEAKTNGAGEYLKKSVDENGNVIKDDDGDIEYEVTTVKTDAERVIANSYTLFPGHEYKKDPTVHVQGGDCYVFIKVENIISDSVLDDDSINTQMAKNHWKAVDAAKYPGLYVYDETTGTTVGKTVVNKGTASEKDLVIFEYFKIKSSATHDNIKNLNNTTLTINAYAVQADGFGSMSAAKTFTTAFPTVYTATTPSGGSEGGTT